MRGYVNSHYPPLGHFYITHHQSTIQTGAEGLASEQFWIFIPIRSRHQNCNVRLTFVICPSAATARSEKVQQVKPRSFLQGGTPAFPLQCLSIDLLISIFTHQKGFQVFKCKQVPAFYQKQSLIQQLKYEDPTCPVPPEHWQLRHRLISSFSWKCETAKRGKMRSKVCRRENPSHLPDSNSSFGEEEILR